MIITCPRCSTRYSVSATVLGVSGRTVRCSHCGTEWLQVGNDEDPRAARPGVRREPEPAVSYHQPYPQQPPASGGAYAPAPQYSQPQPPAQQWSPPPAPPPPPAARDAVAEAPRQAPVAVEPEPAPEPARAPAAAPAQPQPSEEELQKMFPEEPQAMPSFVGSAERQSEDPATSADDIPEPEPIPEVFAPRHGSEDDEEGKGRRWALALGFLMVFLMAVAGGAFFGKDLIIAYLPQAADLYKEIGLYREQPGAGLEVRVSQTDPINNNEGMNIAGVVANVTDAPRAVPLIKVLFLNHEGVEVQSMVLKPVKTELPPAEQMAFQARVERLTPTARRVVVTFTTPELEASANPRGPKG